MSELIKILSTLPFSATEYLQNKESLLLRAQKLYEKKTGRESAPIINEIKAEMENLFHDRELLSVEHVNMPEHLRTGSWIGIVIDGQLIYGQVQVSPKTISVELNGHRELSKLDILAPVIWTEYPKEGSEANEDGKRKSVILLTDLYYSALESSDIGK